MNACTMRALVGASVALLAAVTLAAGSALLALSSTGVLATSGSAWTTTVRLAGRDFALNVPGLLRLATAPGVPHLLDGTTWATAVGTLRFEGKGRSLGAVCAPCAIRHRDLAATPLTAGSLRLTLARDGDRLDGTLTLDDVSVSYTALLASDRIELRWNLPETAASTVLLALASVVPEARSARIEGSLRAHGSLTLPARSGSVEFTASGLEVGGLGTEVLQYGALRFRCVQPNGTARTVVTGDGEKAWAAIDTMGPYLPAAVLAAEDQRFRQHAGYDETEVAALLAHIEDRPTRGASTITQQLARTLVTGHERTAARKLRELLYAIEMERTLGKDRILELYLNTVDWGPGLCGAKAAARAYFSKSPSKLTPIEAAWLAGILRNPHVAWQQQFVARAPERERAAWVLMQMRELPRHERQRFASQPIRFAPGAPVRTQAAPSPLMAGVSRGAESAR